MKSLGKKVFLAASLLIFGGSMMKTFEAKAWFGYGKLVATPTGECCKSSISSNCQRDPSWNC